MIPFYQRISRIIFENCFSRSCSPSWATKQTYFAYFTCPQTHWLPKTLSECLGYTNELKKGCPILSHSLQPFSCWLGWSLWSPEMFYGKISLNLVILQPPLPGSKQFEVTIDIYIPHCKYQARPHYLHGFQLLVLLL